MDDQAQEIERLRAQLSVEREARLRAEAMVAEAATLERLVKARTVELQAARDRALAASDAKSAFLAAISHELRTPLGAVIGYSELLQEEAEEMALTAFVEDLGRINTAAHHLLSLINGVLDLSKIEAGRMMLFVEDFDPVEVIDATVAMVQPIADKNGNTIHIDRSERVLSMYSDRKKLGQCLINLLGNACKFTKNGEVRLSVSERVREGVAWLLFRVSDTGIGMSEAQVAHLWEPFAQADTSTARRYGGTGLGMSLCWRFVHMLGGELSVESVLGQGSSFEMLLPAAVVEDRPLAAAPRGRVLSVTSRTIRALGERSSAHAHPERADRS